MTRVRLSTLFVSLLCLVGCSVDEFRNVQRVKSCSECPTTMMCVANQFCVPLRDQRDAGRDGAVGTDAGSGDAGAVDAGYSGDAGKDADVDAFVPTPCSDNGKVELCYGGKDPATASNLPCRAGTRVCRDGVFGECDGDITPQKEECNGEDDDCDGQIDEMLNTQAECKLDNLKGLCAVGVELCREGVKKCLQENWPESDTCDGDDNDCDGEVDEKTDVSCYESASGCDKNPAGEYQCKGSCRPGIHACKDGKYETACTGEQGPAAEETCTEAGQSSANEDCDDNVDEGCECLDGAECYNGPAETRTREPCHAGTKACTDATHGTCEDEVTPTAEHCGNEGVDNDCNGQQDDILYRNTGCAEVSDGQGACKAGATWQCRDGELECVDAATTAERCDSVDNNCNGAIDENFNLLTDQNNCGACGNVCTTGLSCCGGRCVNLTSNPLHCSACGRQCASGTACCSNSCVDVLKDAQNCGACGTRCPGLLPTCNAGKCNGLL